VTETFGLLFLWTRVDYQWSACWEEFDERRDWTH